MKQDEFDKLMREAARKFTDKRTPTKPETQFSKGASWAWELLMEVRSEIYYEERLRQQIQARLAREPEPWMDELISTTAQLLVDRDECRKEIRETGRTWDSWDKNMNPKKESCPHIAHEKDIMRTLDGYFQALGLSFKATPSKIKDDTHKGIDESDPMVGFYKNSANTPNP